MTPSNELEAADLAHVWHPFTLMAEYLEERPLLVERAEGFLLYDGDGRAYIDGFSSLWCNVHGHRVPELDDALRRQIDLVSHSTLLGIGNRPAAELAARLAAVAPEGLTKVFYSDSGATAVEVALKMSYQYWRQCDEPRPRKTKFLSLGGAYHGDTLGDVSIGDIGRFHSLFAPLLFPVIRAPSPHCYRCPLDLERSNCAMACAGELERLVAQHADELAAVVIEPLVQGAAGMITAPEGYLRRVREVTRECGVHLIADEVAVGFARTGTLFACDSEGVVPDFLCLAKGLTGGYLPLAATLTTPAIFEAFLGRADEGKTFFHGHTYTGNPLGCAVAIASLDKLLRDVLPVLPARIERLRSELEPLRACEIVGDIRQRGTMVGIELVRNRATRERFAANERAGYRVCRMARERGLMIRPLGDTVVLMPAPGMDDATLSKMCGIVRDVVGEYATATSAARLSAEAGSLS